MSYVKIVKKKLNYLVIKKPFVLKYQIFRLGIQRFKNTFSLNKIRL